MQNFKVEIETDPTKGKVSHYLFKEGIQEELVKFLSTFPYSEIKEIINLLDSKIEFSAEEISQTVAFLTRFPIWQGLHIFQLVLTEGNIIPIYLKSETVQSTEEN